MPIDYSEYPANWKTEIRPAVLARANHKCEDCGIANHAVIKRFKGGYVTPGTQEWDMINSSIRYGGHSLATALKKHGFTRIVLTIAHLDHDKSNENVKLERLKALCQKCHLGYDMQHHVANRKYGLKHKENNLAIDFETNCE